MIKVNLNRTRVDTGIDGGATSTATATALSSGGANNRELLVKFLVMIIGVAGLSLYERQNIDDLNSQLAAINGQLNQVKAQVSQKQVELAQLKDIEPQAQALNDKLKILREFSKLRLEQLQNLDYLQTVIPERVWLRSLNFDTKRYQIFGYAMETLDLSDFVTKLEASSYFQDVIVIEDKTKATKTAKIREFEISAKSGERN